MNDPYIRSEIDPHWKAPASFSKYKSKDEALYRRLQETGIEFRGYRFWPPFFCFTCGVGIDASQWCFSRLCGGCDSELGMRRQAITGRRLFSGRVEIDTQTKDDNGSIVRITEERGGFLDPRIKPGIDLAEQARAIRLSLPGPPARPPFRLR